MRISDWSSDVCSSDLAYAPMDETLSRVALDISGRPFTVWKAEFSQKRLGDFDTELFEHWFQSFAQAAGITLHVETLHGRNNHHIIESIFKATARALRDRKSTRLNSSH